MDATVRNAKVNMRRSGVKKGRRGRGRKKFPKCFLLYHHLCNLTSPPSVITFRVEDNCCVCAAHWLPLIFQGKERGKKEEKQVTKGQERRACVTPDCTRTTGTSSGPLEEQSGCHPRGEWAFTIRLPRRSSSKSERRGATISRPEGSSLRKTHPG